MPVKIHGNMYTTVDERIVLLNELIENKQYSLTTSIEHLHFDSEDKGFIIMKARLTMPGLGPDAGPFEGTASEREASSQINETSYVENCETSAAGRAFKHAHIWAGSDHGSHKLKQDQDDLSYVNQGRATAIKWQACKQTCRELLSVSVSCSRRRRIYRQNRQQVESIPPWV